MKTTERYQQRNTAPLPVPEAAFDAGLPVTTRRAILDEWDRATRLAATLGTDEAQRRLGQYVAALTRR